MGGTTWIEVEGGATLCSTLSRQAQFCCLATFTPVSTPSPESADPAAVVPMITMCVSPA